MRISVYRAKGALVLLCLVFNWLLVTLSLLLSFWKAYIALQQQPFNSIALMMTISSIVFKSLTYHTLWYLYLLQYPIPFYHWWHFTNFISILCQGLNKVHISVVMGSHCLMAGWWPSPRFHLSICFLRLLLISSVRLGSQKAEAGTQIRLQGSTK